MTTLMATFVTKFKNTLIKRLEITRLNEITVIKNQNQKETLK